MRDPIREHTPATEDIRLAYIDRQDFIAQIALITREDDELYGAEFDRWLRAIRSAAWFEGFDAGDRTARAVNDEYPDPTPSPYRKTGEGQ